MMASIIFQTYVQLVKNVNFPKIILKLSSESKYIHQFITIFLHKIRHPITLTPLVLKLFKRIKERFALTPQSTQAKHIISPSIYLLVKQLIPIIGLSYIFSKQLMVKFSKQMQQLQFMTKYHTFIITTKSKITILKKFHNDHHLITSLLSQT